MFLVVVIVEGWLEVVVEVVVLVVVFLAGRLLMDLVELLRAR